MNFYMPKNSLIKVARIPFDFGLTNKIKSISDLSKPLLLRTFLIRDLSELKLSTKSYSATHT